MLFQTMTATRSNYFYKPNTTIDYNKKYNNCNNALCFTYTKNYIYKPHTAKGMVGTVSSSLARRLRI